MNQLVENELTKRSQNNYSAETALLIQEGGYISPRQSLMGRHSCQCSIKKASVA